MSIDQHDRTRQPSPDEGPDRPQPPKSSLSITQVVGGALAAMTAAALGSRLSIAGTVVGAALASVIAAVGGALYTASLRRTSKHVGAVITRVRPMTAGSTPAGAQDTRATSTDPPPTDTTLTGTPVDPGPSWVLPSGPEASSAGRTAVAERRSRLGWKTVVVAALLMFVVAALALTGLELATGRALSGGKGTTVGQVAEPSTRPSAEPTERATAKPSATPSATSSASAEPSATSSTPSSAPTAEPSTSSSPAPSTSSTPTPVPTPTPSAFASGAPGAPAAPGASPTS